MIFLGRTLTFIAILYGGLLLGAGNAFLVAERGRDHHDHASTAVFEGIPAHCLFCLNGIVPAITEALEPALPAVHARFEYRRAGNLLAHATDQHVAFEARAPPSDLILI
jgi:hypothetical protein